MGVYAGLAVDCGARIVGGCCGNTPEHVAAMRRGLDAPSSRPRARRRGDRRRARAAGRAARGRAAPARSRRRERTHVNAKAKRRAWRGAAGDPSASAVAPDAASPPLVARRGPAGLRRRRRRARANGSTAFSAAAAAERRLALSRTRLKALIEAGEVTVDGADAARSRAASSPTAPRSVRGAAARRNRRSWARTCRSPSCSRTRI